MNNSDKIEPIKAEKAKDMKLEHIKSAVLAGKIFIYPTDTIYGIGCDATNQESVNKIKEIKQRDKDKPISIIAPSKEWIKQHCIINQELDIDKYLPGPYTLILKKQDPNFMNHISNTDSLGIRIPNNNFCKQIQKANKPFVTTSINIAGESPYTQIKQIPKQIKNQVDHIIEQGGLSGHPSTLVINGKEIKRD
jgi:L-threonylcarbamoyladenylate synthase